MFLSKGTIIELLKFTKTSDNTKNELICYEYACTRKAIYIVINKLNDCDYKIFCNECCKNNLKDGQELYDMNFDICTDLKNINTHSKQKFLNDGLQINKNISQNVLENKFFRFENKIFPKDNFLIQNDFMIVMENAFNSDANIKNIQYSNKNGVTMTNIFVPEECIINILSFIHDVFLKDIIFTNKKIFDIIWNMNINFYGFKNFCIDDKANVIESDPENECKDISLIKTCELCNFYISEYDNNDTILNYAKITNEHQIKYLFHINIKDIDTILYIFMIDNLDIIKHLNQYKKKILELPEKNKVNLLVTSMIKETLFDWFIKNIKVDKTLLTIKIIKNDLHVHCNYTHSFKYNCLKYLVQNNLVNTLDLRDDVIDEYANRDIYYIKMLYDLDILNKQDILNFSDFPIFRCDYDDFFWFMELTKPNKDNANIYYNVLFRIYDITTYNSIHFDDTFKKLLYLITNSYIFNPNFVYKNPNNGKKLSYELFKFNLIKYDYIIKNMFSNKTITTNINYIYPIGYIIKDNTEYILLKNIQSMRKYLKYNNISDITILLFKCNKIIGSFDYSKTNSNIPHLLGDECPKSLEYYYITINHEREKVIIINL